LKAAPPPLDPAMFAPVFLGDPRLYTGQWWKSRKILSNR